jgi:glycosidase
MRCQGILTPHFLINRVMKRLVVVLCLFFGSVQAQILNVDPAFPTQNDVITIIYDATQGNGALQGLTSIFAHTGVITDQSSSPSDWQFVRGNWGTNDPNVAMTNLGNNLFEITIDIPNFYNFPAGTVVERLAFVFRNTNGSVVGRASDGGDIFYEIYPANAGFLGKFFAPESFVLTNPNEPVELVAKTNQNADLAIIQNGQTIAQANNTDILTHTFTESTPGSYWVKFIGNTSTETVEDSTLIIINEAPNIQDPPQGLIFGLNRITPDSVIYQFYAPEKNNVYLIGDFNDWIPTSDYQLNLSEDLTTWWIPLGNLTPGVRYGYQYLVDNQPFADPLSELIADPANDAAIPAHIYPNPYPYPTGKTAGFISLFETDPAPFNWQHNNYVRPKKENLIIYELLVRDFIASHNYQTLVDTLDYLVTLGVNAIELMPVNEFENNESWGYNPSFHMALDKYYGTPEHFKAFVDACHERGIAVIQDVVLNHLFGQSPMVRMYWDAANNRPAANSPWFNEECPHEPFCWGYDINHETKVVEDYIDQINLYWLNEYKVDGYRFDFTKGFVNNSDLFSQTRIDILKRMADTIWAVHPETYIILEHFCDNEEEKILSDYGMMLWGNITWEYHNAIKGFSSNLTFGVHEARGWNDPHLITYIESHDEERGMYEALVNGNQSNPDHNVRVLDVALTRAQTAAVLMLFTPGPKMIWQFGELGYDISINFPCRVCNKPILWNYYFEARRKQIYDVYAASIKLRLNHPTFLEGDYNYNLNGMVKRIIYTHSDMDAIVITNFNVNESQAIAGFTQEGWWYEYFTGDSLFVDNVNMQIGLEAGAFQLWTTERLETPEIISTVNVSEIYANQIIQKVYPNPATDHITLVVDQPNAQTEIKVLDANGSIVMNVINNLQNGEQKIDIQALTNGKYLLYVEQDGQFAVSPFIVNK